MFLSERKYKWIVPEEVPTPGYIKRGKYDECITEFLESGLTSAKVNIPKVKPQSTYLLLRDRLKKMGLEEKTTVCLRKGNVFLVRLGGGAHDF